MSPDAFKFHMNDMVHLPLGADFPPSAPAAPAAPAIAAFEKLLGGPRDSALLRFGLGTEYLKAGQPDRAVPMFESAIQRDPSYSAAWKALGKSLAGLGRPAEARIAFEQGIAVAEKRGDVQAAKEMKVFLKRLDKAN
jgi:predicted Zn-dependent protease